MSGSLKAVVQAQGAVKHPQNTRMSASVERLNFSRNGLTVANEGPLLLSYEHGRLEVPTFTLRGPESVVAAQGWVDPDALEFFMHGSVDLKLLESLVPSLTRTGGRVELNALASGSLRQPSVVGNAFFTDAKLSVRDQAVSVRGLTGRLEFTEQRLLLESLEGKLNEGDLRATGEVKLEKLRPSDVRLTVGLDNVTVRAYEDLPFISSGELVLTGQPDALKLGGALDLHNLRYRRGLELDDILKRLAGAACCPRPRRSPASTSPWTWG
jgi:translocation and assembly module TamB